jgi:replication factor A1
MSCQLTLWGKTAAEFSPEQNNPIIAFKAVRVGEYNGELLLDVNCDI